MTLIELCVTIGIASVLFSMALFLAQHVNAITKIRRAQAELAYWHTAIDDWFVQFGEYPCFDKNGDLVCSMDADKFIDNLVAVTNRACAVIDGQEIYFSTYVVGAPSHIDPWGKPYILICLDDDPEDPPPPNPRIIYYLFSCGPNGESPKANDYTKDNDHDDVYFGQ